MAMTDMTDIGQQGCSLPDQAGKLQEVMALIAFLRRKYIRPLKCIVGPWLASVALLSGFAAPAAAEVLVSNLGQGNDLDHYPITNIIDQKFTTGNNRRGYDVESVTLRFKGNVPTNQGAFQLEIREGSASLADRICALGNPASLDAGDRTFSASSCPNLDKDESYYLTIVTSHHAKLVRVSSNNEDAGKASGWSINNNSKTLTQGSHSQLHSQSLKFRMEGEIINTLPTAADGLVQATEDIAYPFAAADFNFSDLDSNDDSNDLLDHVTIITLPTEGTLALNGVAVMAGDEVTKQSLDDDELTYTPPANVNGVDIASFTFKVNDGKDDSESAYSMNINVTAVNDAPTASPKTVTATEDTDYPFTATDFSFMDIDQGDTLNHVTITTVPGTGKGELLLDGAVIAMSDLDKDVTAGELGDSKLKYRPPTDENGDNYASFSFTVNDGEDDSESAYSMNINVTAVNDPPIPMDDDAETPENTPVEIEVLANDEDVDEGTALSVTRVGTADGIDTATETNPANGTVTITGSGTTITYTPDSNFITGTDTFTYVVSDNATSPLTPLTAVGTVTVTVISDASNARLSGLTMSRGTLEPDFSASTTSYTASVANSVDSISLTPTTERTGARVTVNGTAVTRGSASAAIPLAEGVVTSIPVVVTPQDRNAEKRTYTINVTRVSANADLSNLALSTGTLKPDFSAANTSYIASVANDVASLTLTAAASHDNARLTLTVDGKDVESTGSSASADIDLREGETTKISIKVTAQDGTTTQTYSIEVSRAPSDNAALSYLQLSKGTLAPLFAPHITSYSASVGNDVTSLTVTPSTANDNATVTVNGNEVIRGSASDAIPLALGNNTIPVVVTAQDGTTTQSYSITVTRAAADASDVATLSALSLSPESLNETFVSSTTSYTANVLNSVASVTLTAAATNDNARLTLTVNDEEVESTGSNSANRNIPLREGETTRIRIKVTAQDGETTQTYSIEVSRAPSDNAALSHLQLSEGTLAPLFAPHITSYSASVGNDVASLTVTPSTSNENATVTVNGNEVSSDNPSDAISLALGNNTIPVVVTAQDGTTTQSYSITVTRAAATASSDATLASLSLSPESLNETFASSTTSYTASVANDVASVTLTAAATNDNARLTLTVNDEDVESSSSGSASADIDLREGEITRIRIKVTAEDGTTTQTYNIEVSRAASDNAALSYLQLSAGTLAPLFDPHTTSYSASVANAVERMTLTPTTANENATVTVDDVAVSSGNASADIALSEGENSISVVVTAQDGTTTQSYSITVTRAAATASNDATLNSLSLSQGTLNETFASDTTSYTAEVLNSVASLTLTAAATDNNARLTLTVNDEDVESSSSGSASADIDLREGEITRISIKVTAEDGTTTQTYSIEVSRAASDNAALSYLQLSAGTLAPLFDPHTTSYSASVANAVERMTLTPTTANENATVTVDDVAVSSGNASADIALSEGENSISVVVTAQDGTTTQSYSITVTRAAATASSDATLASLSLSQGSLNETFASDTTSYTAEVLNSVASVTLTAAATDNNARLTLTVNDEDVESSSSNSANRNIPLREGETTRIRIKVTAQDGETTQTYNIEVSRAPSDNAALSHLQLSEGTLAPLFAPHITSYSASVGNDVASLTVTPSTSNENATVTVNGNEVIRGSASDAISLALGNNTIPVVVTAQDGTTTQSYSITVTRAAADASDVATLSALSLSPESLNETFASSTTSYTASVANDVASVTLTAAATNDNARLTLTVDDEDVESSSSSSANRNIPLREGETTRIRIKVTAQDGETTQTYSIEVSRAPSDNAALSHLQLSEGTLAPLFAPHITSYSASVGNDVASLTVTPSTSNDNATVTINGNEVTSDNPSDAISLALGNNTIPVVVTAQDGTTTQSYSITVTRAAADASDVATLSALSLSPESLNETFVSSTTSYTANVLNSVASVTLTAAATNDNARLTLTVNDEDVESTGSSASADIDLREGETTRIRIKVTAQDGETTQTYSIEVSRAPSDNAALSHLQLSEGTLAPLFAPHITSYSASVGNDVASLTVTPSTSNENATVTVNGNEVTSDNPSDAISLALGNNTIPVVVTAQDGTTTQSYSITVTRAAATASSDATLASLSLSPESLNETFASSTTSYTASVANDVASVTLTAAATNDNARLTLTVNDEDVESSSSGSVSADIDLREGEITRIRIKVTAEDGTTTQTYNIEVSRAASDNAALSYLQLSAGTLAPLFDPHTTSYSASVANAVERMTLTPTTANENATVTVDDVAVSSGNASADIALSEGENSISVVVTAQDGTTTQSYSITVTRAAATASNDATLNSLSLSQGTLNETFASDTTSYTAEVLNSVASLTLTAAATDNNARLTLTVNDEDVESSSSGSASADIDLREGEITRISIKVTAEDGTTTQTYSIEVSRAASDNAALSYLQLSAGTLAPLFDPHTTSYSASVANAVERMTLTPTTANENATVTVDDVAVSSGNASADIALSEGENSISVVVTAQDGTTTQSYSITVTRAAATASSDATLASLSLSQGSLNETFASDTTSYTAEVLNSVASVTLTAAATDNNARLTLTVNDEDMESSSSNSANRNIPLREGETTRIRIKVTAQDGETTQTYNIEVSRAPSDNAALSHLQLSEGTLAPLFAPHITSYSASVANDVASLTVTPSTSNENATVTVNGNEVSSDNPSDAISLALGNNTIPVVVTAQDGTTTQSYSITVTRAAADASDVATLSALSLSPESLNETFASSTTSYTASVANDVASVTLTAAATNDNARLTLTVDDEDVESSSSSANRNIPLREGETTRIRIKVTAQDGETTQTYSIEVSRAPSDNAALSHLQLSEGTLAPLFAPHITSYSASVGNDVASLTVTPSTSNDNATVTVNGNEVTSDNPSDAISLALGNNTIPVVVTAQDGTTTQSYSITVTRAAADASDVATLSALSLSPESLNETFASSTTSYTANVLNSVASVTLTAAATNDNARLTLTVNDEDVESSSSNSANRNIPLREGETTRIRIKVTAQDGETTQTYSIEVSRAPSDNAALSHLQLSEGTLAPLFAPHITSYSASVGNDVASLTVTPSTSNENATVTVNGNEVTSDNPSDAISLALGNNTIPVVVTAQDGTTTQSYSITVTRAAADASDVATLASLSLSPESLNETFASSTTSYTASVANDVASVTLTAAATNDNARLTLTVNDEDVESSSSNSANRNIPLREGETTRIRIKVTAQDGETTQTYSIEVSRAPSDNAALSHLQLSEGTLAPLFDPHITSYSASVANDVASLTVTPSTSNENATVTVNGNEVTSDNPSDAISLALGNNTIPVVVTAQDGTTTQSYSITVTRAAATASSDATLASLSLSPESLNETFASSTTSYTASVANDVASVTLTAAATNDNARLTLTVNDEDVESSSSNSANRNIPLREGETTRIRIKVTAQDGETTQTYSIEVSRAPSDNAALSHLQLSEGTLAPLFAPHITSYSASVGNDVASLTVTPSTSNENATVTVNGNEVTSDNPSDAISLALGNNTIPVVVTAQDGTTTQSYSITVTRAAATASSDATLASLSLSPESLNETFASSTTSYSASVANDVASVTLTAAATNDNARLTLTVNDEEVESTGSNSANRNIPLREGETTRIRIKVTAQDGETTQTYSIEVSRAPSDNAALSHLQLSEGTLAPLFAPHITSYSASVGNDVASLTVTPSTSNDNATVTVNGNEVTSDSASDAISLALGNNTIPVVVTAQDGTTTQSYSITVTRAAVNASDVATLSALSLSPESLNETFASSTTSYTVSVANDVASVTLTAAATNDNARLTLTVDDEDVESSSSSSANRNIPLREGETTRIRIKVTAEDGTTTQTYNIEVSRAASDNAALSYLQLSAGTLAPLFDPHITSYSASVANAVERMTLTPTTANENATVTVDDVAVSSGNASADIALSEGENSISVVVTAQDGTTTQSYSITVTRAAATASNDATLNSLSLSQGTLNETFASDTTSYTAEVLNSVASLTLTAAATDNNARLTLTVNDEDVESSSSGSASADIDLREGEITRISIKVTAEDGTTTQTYSIEVSRAASDNAALSYLQLSAGTLAPLFDPHTTSYSASVANAVERMTLTPTTANENATVTVDDVAVSSGNASADIALSEGENSISVVVTAQDGTTTQSYSITVTRAAATASSDATLASLSLSQGSLNETFASDTTSYTAEVLNSVASVTLTAAATDNNARLTLTVNDEDVESSSSNSANRNIPLREGETTRIRIKVTAQDGETTQTYNIEVSRAPSDNAALSHLQLSEGTLAPLFAPHITSYSASVGNDVASLTVTPSTSNENATVTVNGNEVIRGSASDAISLALGNNTIPVVVTAQDGTTTQSYSITVTRAAVNASDVATLSALSLSPESLNETFASSTTSYTVSVANDVASVTLTAAATNDNARLTLTVDDEDVESSSSSSANRNIPLREGETTRIRIKVTAEDGTTTQTYNIEVSRAASDNAALSYLQLSAGTLAPLFDPHITSYSASVANAVERMTLTPTTANENATVTVDDVAVSSGNASADIALSEGENSISVVVTAQDGTTTQSYSITVTRAAATASNDATLNSLSLSQGTLNETFASDTTSYTAEVLNSVASLTLTAAATDNNARLTLTVNDEDVESSSSGSASADIDLREGEITRISIKVTAEDGTTTQTYSIEVSRAASDNAALSYLQLSAGTLAPLFDPHITSYSASVANAVERMTLTPTTANENATVTVDDVAVSSGNASADIALSEGENSISVVVTAQTGRQHRVTASLSPVPLLPPAMMQP